jgi:hypothetical protein
MATQQTSRFCKRCNTHTLHMRHTFSAGWGLLLTLLTAGMFLILWIPMMVLESFRPWRCQMCGKGRMI